MDHRLGRRGLFGHERVPRHRPHREPDLLPDPHAIQFWMGPDAHMLHYAIGGRGESVNFFAVVETPRQWLHPGSTAPVADELPVASFRGWHPAITEMIEAAASPVSWALFTVRPLLRWYEAAS